MTSFFGPHLDRLDADEGAEAIDRGEVPPVYPIRAAVFQDNVGLHLTRAVLDSQLEHRFKTLEFPPNCTAVLQPMDLVCSRICLLFECVVSSA